MRLCFPPCSPSRPGGGSTAAEKGVGGSGAGAHIREQAVVFDGIECVCLIVTDLTEQKRNQEIVAAERLARSILDQAAGAILVVDPDGKIIRASRAAGQLAKSDRAAASIR